METSPSLPRKQVVVEKETVEEVISFTIGLILLGSQMEAIFSDCTAGTSKQRKFGERFARYLVSDGD
jgi:hypothetical protein